MPYQFTVSPDFTSEQVPHWYVFNTWLQRTLGESFHLELHPDFQKLRAAIQSDAVDLIYANPFDAALLVREKGFIPIATAAGRSDETLVAVAADSPCQRVQDLAPGTSLVSTDAPDVEMLGRILLEPANLDRTNTTLTYAQNQVLTAKLLLQGKASAGFFLKASFDELSELVRSRLRVIATSRIYVLQHALLASPRLWPKRDQLVEALRQMPQDPKGQKLLQELKFNAGWKELSLEEAEFMIDLMATFTT